jgi:hypothetical protein
MIVISPLNTSYICKIPGILYSVKWVPQGHHGLGTEKEVRTQTRSGSGSGIAGGTRDTRGITCGDETLVARGRASRLALETDPERVLGSELDYVFTCG